MPSRQCSAPEEQELLHQARDASLALLEHVLEAQVRGKVGEYSVHLVAGELELIDHITVDGVDHYPGG